MWNSSLWKRNNVQLDHQNHNHHHICTNLLKKILLGQELLWTLGGRNVFTWSTTYSQHSLSRLLCGLSKRRRCPTNLKIKSGNEWCSMTNSQLRRDKLFHPTCFSHHWRWPGHSGTCASREPSCRWQPLVWEFTMASPWLSPHAFTATNLSFRAKP